MRLTIQSRIASHRDCGCVSIVMPPGVCRHSQYLLSISKHVNLLVNPDDANALDGHHVQTERRDGRDAYDDCLISDLLHDFQSQYIVSSVCSLNRCQDHKDVSVVEVVEDKDVVDSAEVEAVSRILYKVARSERVPRVGSPDRRQIENVNTIFHW